MFKVYGESDIGCARKENEDSIWFNKDNESLYAIVADGMGGHEGGKEASQIAVDEFRHHVEKIDSNGEAEIVVNSAIYMADKKIKALAKEKFGGRPIGTTCSSIILKKKSGKEEDFFSDDDEEDIIGDAEVCYFHIGDSRIYLIRKNEGIAQISKDHTLVAKLIAEGIIDDESALNNLHKNMLYKALGTGESPYFGAVDSGIFDVFYNDYILLCSDGLTNYVEEDEIYNIINKRGGVKSKCKKMITLAKERGGLDNISAILVQITQSKKNK